MKEFKEQIADILIKIFQILFGMLVVGMALRDRFDAFIFALGLMFSAIVLTLAINVYYNVYVEEDE